MQNIIASKSDKTKMRIKSIENSLSSYHASIARLHTIFNEHIDWNVTSFAPRRIKYSRIPKSLTTYQSTLKNISNQILILEKELEALIKYGA